MTSGSLWNYHRNETNDDANESDKNNRINNNKTITRKYFEYNTKTIQRTLDDNNTLNAEVVVPLKYLSNFWRFLDLPVINCEIKFDLSWSKEFIISEISITPTVPGNLDANSSVSDMGVIQTTGETFETKSA